MNTEDEKQRETRKKYGRRKLVQLEPEDFTADDFAEMERKARENLKKGPGR